MRRVMVLNSIAFRKAMSGRASRSGSGSASSDTGRGASQSSVTSFFDGLSINRSQDNFVVQWGDPNADEKDARPLAPAATHVPAQAEPGQYGEGPECTAARAQHDGDPQRNFPCAWCVGRIQGGFPGARYVHGKTAAEFAV